MSPRDSALAHRLAYRPEIDGLRALAVLAVLFFHANLACPGGYVGVDVFFVISGYLITSLIFKDLHSGSFTLAGFYERRARRIVPALAVVVLATLIAGWFILMPADYAALGKSALWQSFGAANFHFWLETGYFAAASEEQPLLHTWSLAVEEQFYFFIPVLLVGLYRIPERFRRRVLVSLSVAAIAAGLAYAAHEVRKRPDDAFYLLPSRAWELLLGSILSILPISTSDRLRPVRELLSLVGLASILAACFLYTSDTPFPGLAAAAPCTGAFLFIWANSRDRDDQPLTYAGRLLATRPLVFVGLISYSLYLWHWPLFALSTYVALGPVEAEYRLAIIALSLLLATLSWRFVETPFRRRTACRTRRSVFATAAASLAGCMLLGGALLQTGGVPGRIPQTLLQRFPDEPNHLMMVGKELTADDIRAGRLVPFGVERANQPCTMLVWGDSHAVAALPAFDELFKSWGLAGRAATHNSTPPLVNHFARTEYGLSEASLEFNREVVAYIRRNRIPHTVLVCAWDGYVELLERPVEGGASCEPVPTLDAYQTALLETVRELRRAGTQPWIMLQPPRQPYAKKIVRAVYAGLDERRFCSTPAASNGVAGDAPAYLAKLQAAGARIIDARSGFLDRELGVYLLTKNGAALYRDEHHLSTRGALTMLTPVFEQSFRSALQPQIAANAGAVNR
ncbi:MAG TPA: acyltransferase family protein [Lacipirellula sp.]